MNKPIKQHYVPQVYLKFFSHKYEWEKYYAEQVEPLIRRIFPKLIQKCTNVFVRDQDVVIDEEIRSALSVIIITQLSRTPKARSYNYEISSKMFPEVMRDILNDLEPYINADQRNYLHNFTLDKVFKEIEMQTFTDPYRISRLAQMIYDRYWIVYRNNNYKKNPFATSDHPVVQYNMVATSTSLRDNGIANPQTIIHFPLNSQLMLAIYDRKHFMFRHLKDMDSKLTFLSDKDEGFITKVNQTQYEQCIQHVYFRPM
ncbi:DUF4238 domain-containing protein [Shouchella lonarensis]|uniref:DUF4238 domain-containing protein n=1 Tax=Shouchella lonarensis TaxID=1464122 RepID=A0A1G6GJ56_9BACI|nr:DUF4238 domain-containing protein [Shouchella lonarensis]SDB81863.1 Protein of unknown function [Shouchella lonarensis]